MKRLLILAVVYVFGTALAIVGDASAQSAACVDLCRIPCVKPISIADRWDNVTGIPGYMGEGTGRSRRPDWRLDPGYNREPFTDANANGLWDPGESWTDGDGDGVYDAEAYHPLLTGYAGTDDAGLELVLHAAQGNEPPVPGLYRAIALPPENKGTPDLTSEAYRFAWSNCTPTPVEPADQIRLLASGILGPTNQGMQDLIAQDPDAEWDDATQSVIGSDFDLSPRIWFIPVHDPRIPITNGSPQLVITKVIAFFAERMTGSAECRGRLLRVQAPGESCGGGSAGGFIVSCPVPAPATSWGKIKASYR